MLSIIKKILYGEHGFMRKLYLLSAIIFVSSVIMGCSVANRWVYRPDVNQGNYIAPSEIDKLEIGQTKKQVMFILGTPMLNSVFTDNTWYYVFREWPTHQKVTQKTYIIKFDKNEKVSSIEHKSIGDKSLKNMDKNAG